MRDMRPGAEAKAQIRRDEASIEATGTFLLSEKEILGPRKDEAIEFANSNLNALAFASFAGPLLVVVAAVLMFGYTDSIGGRIAVAVFAVLTFAMSTVPLSLFRRAKTSRGNIRAVFEKHKIDWRKPTKAGGH